MTDNYGASSLADGGSGEVGTREQTPYFRLTPREREVLALVVEGLGDSEIAHRLTLRRRTVSHHVSKLLDKSGLPNRSALAVYAVRNGLA